VFVENVCHFREKQKLQNTHHADTEWLEPLPLPLPMRSSQPPLRPMWQFVLVRGWPKLTDSFGAPTAAAVALKKSGGWRRFNNLVKV